MALLLTLFLPINIFSSPQSTELIEEVTFQQTLRSKTLMSFDKMLSWTFDQQRYAFTLKTPLKPVIFHVTDSKIIEFSHNYSYFSDDHPLIAKVTSDPSDLLITLQLLEDIHRSVKDDKQKQLMTDEVLAKVLAYRDLKKGQEISIPSHGNQLVTFEVDELFDLGKGMPAFGFTPKKKGTGTPFLLFRGTDVSILSQRGLASVISDLDPQGPGLTAFLQSRSFIHDWLTKVAQNHSKAKLIGFSLGGVLAAYTHLYEHDLINNDPLQACSIFNPPGISKKVFREWEETAPNKKSNLKVFVTRGDLIPKIGRLMGDIFELSADRPLFPIAAHVTLISAEAIYYQNAVDLKLENQSNRFSR